MKSIKYLKLFLMTLALGLVTTSCMDDDWKDPTGDLPLLETTTWWKPMWCRLRN